MEILEYLKQFLIQSNWLDENVPEQARALFTSWCLMENVIADTGKCDAALIDLYNTANIQVLDISFEDFTNYMIEHIYLI